uniref:Uncharacterized protein n=1 Tax=Bionectria ochroleuca TaxID=29856 RepID=A0A8H7KCL0_BIOOC
MPLCWLPNVARLRTGEVAALDVAAQELTALGEADGVDGGRRGEDGVGGEGLADLVELGGHVAEEGGRAVGAGIGAAERDGVDKGSRVDGVGELAYLLEALAVEGVAEPVPDDDRQRGVVGFIVADTAGSGVDGRDCQAEGKESERLRR